MSMLYLTPLPDAVPQAQCCCKTAVCLLFTTLSPASPGYARLLVVVISSTSGFARNVLYVTTACTSGALWSKEYAVEAHEARKPGKSPEDQRGGAR